MKTLLILASLAMVGAPAMAASECADICPQDTSEQRVLLSRVDAPAQDVDGGRAFVEAQQKNSHRRKIRLPLRLPFGVIN